MDKEITINKNNKNITFINNGIAFSQFGVADEILDLIIELQEELKYQKEMEIEYNEKHTKLMKKYTKQKEILDKIKELTLQRKHCEDLFGGKEKTINDKILELLEEIE